MWPFKKYYSSETWELIDWSYIDHFIDYDFAGYGVKIRLRNKNTGKPCMIKIGGNFLTCSDTTEAIADRLFKKTGILIKGETLEF